MMLAVRAIEDIHELLPTPTPTPTPISCLRRSAIPLTLVKQGLNEALISGGASGYKLIGFPNKS